MKLPQVVTKYKIRDAKICRLWAEDLMTAKAIGKLFKLTGTRIHTIINKNAEFIDFSKKVEKNKRIVWLKRAIKKAKATKKDAADLQLQLKVEIEGDKPLVQINTYNQIWNEKIEKTKEVDANGRITAFSNN